MIYKQRQQQLIKELQAMSTVCFVCHQSQQKKMCEILIDNTKCKKDICVLCYKLHKNDPCTACAQKIEQHFKKGKIIHKSSMFDQANKMYNRQYKIRSNQQFQTLDFDFINLMAYYNAHPQVSVRKKFEEIEKQTKRILENKKKDQRTLVTQAEKIRQAKILSRNHEQEQSGLLSCGYNQRYDKGINILRVTWGYPALSSQQFKNLNHLMRNLDDENQQIKEESLIEMKLSKKSTQTYPVVDSPIQQQQQESYSQVKR